MTAVVLNGREIADKVLDECAKEIQRFPVKPRLSVILVGDDLASHVYVKNKALAAEKVGMVSSTSHMHAKTTEEALLSAIYNLNQDPGVNGILVQMPLPKHISEQNVITSIHPAKDVDGLTPVNMGKLVLGEPGLYSCTPQGVMRLIKEAGVKLEGKHAVVVGRSNLVGKPVSFLLLHANATVTICHSRTKNLAEITRQADVLVVAVGKPKLITLDMVKEGAVVIDVGTNSVGGKLVGDVDFDAVKEKVRVITPVPRGVGPMTIAYLMKNTVQAFKTQHGLP